MCHASSHLTYHTLYCSVLPPQWFNCLCSAACPIVDTEPRFFWVTHLEELQVTVKQAMVQINVKSHYSLTCVLSNVTPSVTQRLTLKLMQGDISGKNWHFLILIIPSQVRKMLSLKKNNTKNKARKHGSSTDCILWWRDYKKGGCLKKHSALLNTILWHWPSCPHPKNKYTCFPSGQSLTEPSLFF